MSPDTGLSTEVSLLPLDLMQKHRESARENILGKIVPGDIFWPPWQTVCGGDKFDVTTHKQRPHTESLSLKEREIRYLGR